MTVWRRAQSYVNATVPWVPSVRLAIVLVPAVYVYPVRTVAPRLS